MFLKSLSTIFLSIVILLMEGECVLSFLGAGGFSNDFDKHFRWYLASDSSSARVVSAAVVVCSFTWFLHFLSMFLWSCFFSVFVLFN